MYVCSMEGMDEVSGRGLNKAAERQESDLVCDGEMRKLERETLVSMSVFSRDILLFDDGREKAYLLVERRWTGKDTCAMEQETQARCPSACDEC